MTKAGIGIGTVFQTTPPTRFDNFFFFKCFSLFVSLYRLSKRYNIFIHDIICFYFFIIPQKIVHQTAYDRVGGGELNFIDSDEDINLKKNIGLLLRAPAAVSS